MWGACHQPHRSGGAVCCSNEFSLPYSRFAFHARAGQAYFFQAGGLSFRDPTGILVFNLRVGVSPVNDDVAAATVIKNLPFADSVDTLTATIKSDEPTPGCGIGSVAASVWYSVTPEQDAILVADTAGSQFFDPVIAVYEGTALSDLVPIACNAPVAHARVGFQAAAGRTYLFQVGTPSSLQLGPGGPDFQGRYITGIVAFSVWSVPLPQCSAPSFSVPDRAGDPIYPWLPSDAPDVLSVSGGLDTNGENFCLFVEFADRVDPPDAGSDHAIFTWVYIDIDEDPATGYAGTDFYCAAPVGLGIDTAIWMAGGYGVLVPTSQAGAPDGVVLFEDASFTLSIPLLALGDGLPVNFVLLVGYLPPRSGMPVLLSPSDCIPDDYFIHWPTMAGDVRCDDSIDSIDAALVLQYHAGLAASLPCQDAADANGDDVIDGIDAALILQYHAGLIESLSV